MGFEEAVPPVPDRLAEIKMMDRLQKSWLDQPFNRYYMQEDLRQTKMEYAQYNLQNRRRYLADFLLVSLFTLPLAYFSRRFYVYNSFKSGGIPFVKELTNFQKQHTPYFSRNKAGNKAFVAVYMIATTILSLGITNWNYRSDQNYDKFSKVKRML